MRKPNDNISDPQQKGKDMVLMLFLFRGGYLTESNKLGHEIINLFRDDNGNHYFYVVPWGHVNKEYVDRIGSIILARHVGNREVEIIAKANVKGNAFPGVKESLFNLEAEANREKLKKIKKEHSEYCKGITYGGKNITDIYQYDENGDEQQVLVSYEVEDFRFSKPDKETNQFPRLFYPEDSDSKEKEIIEKNANDHRIYMKGKMAKNTLKEYFPKKYNQKNNQEDNQKANDSQENYRLLLQIIKDPDGCYWEENDNSEPIKNKDYSKEIDDYSNILKIIGKEDNEIIFSNWLFYYFSNREMLNNFILDVLKKEIAEIHEMDESFTITREKEHIDIRIEDNNQIVIIENKIKSRINGIKDKKDNTSCEKKESQLSEYYNKVLESEKDKDSQRSIHCFIFVPRYNYKLIEMEKENLKDGDKYHLISYEAIYEFFLNEKWKNSKYIDDFRVALRRHTSQSPDSLREDTLHKFLERINELKTPKK